MKTSIDRVCETKFLGVVINDRLSWTAQIQSGKSKLVKTVTIMNCTGSNTLFKCHFNDNFIFLAMYLKLYFRQ